MSKSIQERYPITRLTAFFKAFPDEKACKEYLVKTLYPKGFVRSLPSVCHIISNFKAHIAGTYHSVHKEFLQSCMDEFASRYNNRRNVDVFHILLTDVCFSLKRTRPLLAELFKFQSTEAQKQAA